MSYLFDADGEMFYCTDVSALFDRTSAATMACWVNQSASSIGIRFALHLGVSTGAYNRNCIAVYANASEQLALYTGNATSAGNATPTDIGASSWALVVITRSSGSRSDVYINGSATTYSRTTSLPETNPDRLAIGGDSASNASYELAGHVAHVAVWSRVLSGAEIDALYNGGTGGVYGVNPMSLAGGAPYAYWPLTDSGDFGDVAGSHVLTNTDGGATYSSSNPLVDPYSGASAVAPIVMKWRM